MPEYLAPGVYVEETSFRQKTLEGVSTSTAGFVGIARFGPVEGEPELLTSFNEFERLYGGLESINLGGEPRANYLAHAVRAFFEEGGQRCYVARVFEAGTAANLGVSQSQPSSTPVALTISARFPGRAGDMRITFMPRLGQNVLRQDPLSDPANPVAQLQGVKPFDTVLLTPSGGGAGTPQTVSRNGDELELIDDSDPASPVVTTLSDLASDLGQTVQVLTVDVLIERPIERPLQPDLHYSDGEFIQGFTLHPKDSRSLTQYFQAEPASRRMAQTVPFSIDFTNPAGGDASGIHIAQELFDFANLASNVTLLSGGADGILPLPATYRGSSGDGNGVADKKSGLGALEALEDISIVAVPGYSFGYIGGTEDQQRSVRAIQQHLIVHCEKMRYRIGVLDSPNGASLSEVREYRAQVDSKYAAMYYPWIKVVDPLTGEELDLPPSGNVAGIYARNDVERGVQKAPANEVVRMAVGFETFISKAQQDVLNPEGINCFRFFEGRGYRLWGARTVSSDNEWKYVNLRRYFAYLERSIDKGTQVFVFESNGERLWENVRRTVEDFLLNEWKSSRLMGVTPEEAFFVRCDRTTMTQNDIDNGRLICLVGVAPLRPAEFVIFRIGQKLIESA